MKVFKHEKHEKERKDTKELYKRFFNYDYF